jgi:hypothetical protein
MRQQKEVVLLPSGPKEAVPFGAYSETLKYTSEWDKLWPVSNNADVIVRFGDNEPRFVFWRGTSYIPCWATYNGPWFTNEFFERRSGSASGTTSMVEPMSDKQCRYSNVSIIENSEARVVIHWRYAPTDLEYQMAYVDEETNWGDWADEYYILYPDAVGTRKATLFTSALNDWIEYQESIVVNQPGTYPDDNLNSDALTLLNLKGDSKIYSWTSDGGPKLDDLPDQFCIQKINFKSIYKPFTIVNPENVKISSYKGHALGSSFNFWDHWPVSQFKSDTRAAKSSDNPSHTSLAQIKWKPYSENDNSKTWVMMHGMSRDADSNLITLAKSWIHPADLTILTKNFISKGYDQSQRAYIISRLNSSTHEYLDFELKANQDSPVVNPTFIIENWDLENVGLIIDGKRVERGEKFRLGKINRLNESGIIVWIKLESAKPVRIYFQ